MEEELDKETVFNKLCPGLNVFNHTNALGDLSPENILEMVVGSPAADYCKNEIYLNNAVHLLADHPKLLFYMMSVAPEVAALTCRDFWIKTETYSINLCDLVRVFLNWGATTESLGIADDHHLSNFDIANKHQVSTFVPGPHNVKLVLATITDCITTENNNNADKMRYDLIKVLIYAVLDENHRQYMSDFCNAIDKVLEAFPCWDIVKALGLIQHLRLSEMKMTHSAYVTCCIFNQTSPRAKLVGVEATRHLLNVKFGLLPAYELFPTLIEALPTCDVILKRFSLEEIYIFIQLLNYVFVLCVNASPRCPMVMVVKLQDWAKAFADQLKREQFLHPNRQLVREKVIRLETECINVIVTRRNESALFMNQG